MALKVYFLGAGDLSRFSNVEQDVVAAQCRRAAIRR